jgi:Inner membrane component domain
VVCLRGLWLFIGYAFAAVLCFIFIITIPFGVASLRIALYCVWPFGRAVVPQANKGIGPTMGNVIWFRIDVAEKTDEREPGRPGPRGTRSGGTATWWCSALREWRGRRVAGRGQQRLG